MFNYEELSLEVDWKITRAIFQIRANHDPERVTAFLSPSKGRVMGKYDRKRERVTRMFFLTIFKQEVYPKSYKDSPRGLTSSIRTFHYRSKGPFTQAIFVAATRCNFGGAKVAASKSHV